MSSVSCVLVACLCSSFHIALCRDFGDPLFWEDSYRRQMKSDWYNVTLQQVLEQVHAILSPAALAAPEAQVLHVGCGTSSWSEELANQGWNVTNIDQSSAAIEQMKARIPESPQQRFRVMNVAELTVMNKSFDLVFDKGTLHALYAGINSLPLARAMVAEVFRVLREEGLFISISGSATGHGIGHDIIKEQPGVRWLGERTVENQQDLDHYERHYGFGRVPKFLIRPSYWHVAVAMAATNARASGHECASEL